MVLNQNKEDVLIDRGVTIVLAAVEVGPHIKALRAETGLPHAFIQNASWWLRRAGVWTHNAVRYPWLYRYREGMPEGIEGLTETARVAAGLSGPDTPFHIWRDAPPNTKSSSWWGKPARQGPSPECGTSYALGRHRRAGEECATCKQAQTERHERWIDRKARVKKQRAEYQRRRDESERVSLKEWEELLEGEKGGRTSVCSLPGCSVALGE